MGYVFTLCSHLGWEKECDERSVLRLWDVYLVAYKDLNGL